MTRIHLNIKSVFRIRIDLNTDPEPDPAFKVNTDPDPAPDPDFLMTKMKEKILSKILFLFFSL